MPFSINSTVKEIIDNEEAKAVMEKHVPGISNHPSLPMAYYMSVKEC